MACFNRFTQKMREQDVIILQAKSKNFGNIIVVKYRVKRTRPPRNRSEYDFPLREAAKQNISRCLGHTTLRIELKSTDNNCADVKRS
ncbi:hypothetical protein Rleg9DRAFT_5411 [Rhizobium leguminosarum bv. trifolii WSM597]|uniref:Uncharacterized protein n=1 Tax=Rhizobium leguminosarum bv. trifolii WSM597 TaxID=754764 RepID=J0H873_RHILT|nr:hypothetical protein Rleg9DRAFT_5411 [Rhizobium leguminosarum bv. trifolii WSM597]